MKTVYRGHEIEVYRDECLAGYSLLYYSIFRLSDGYECDSGFSEEETTVRGMIKNLKERIDNELNEDDPWMEKETNHE
jgi:hypothetical protein